MNASDQVFWTEKYRPHKVSEVVLPTRLKEPFVEYVKQGWVPSLILSGTPGIGKTTIALAALEEIGCDYMFLNGSSERNIDTFHTKIKGYASSMSLTGGRKAIVIDEADYMNAESLQPALRGAMEEFASNCSFIYTCNFRNKIIPALHSRCAVIDFQLHTSEKAAMATEFMHRLQDILKKEGVAYDLTTVATVLKKHFPDYRRTLNELQRYVNQGHGKIDAGILESIQTDASFAALIKSLKGKDFTAVRKWVGNNSDIDPTRVFRFVYDNLYEHMSPDSIPSAVIILAEYGYRNAFCADPEINTVAALAQLMGSVEWK